MTIATIQRIVAEYYDIPIADMTSRRRPAHIVWPRQVAMYLSRKVNETTLADVAEHFGHRHHGTILHACRVVTDRIEVNGKDRQHVAILEGRIHETADEIPANDSLSKVELLFANDRDANDFVEAFKKVQDFWLNQQLKPISVRKV